MKIQQIKKGRNILHCNIDERGEILIPQEVVSTWSNSFREVLSDDSNHQKGLRPPQFGAICAIRSFWTISREAATVVMPC